MKKMILICTISNILSLCFGQIISMPEKPNNLGSIVVYINKKSCLIIFILKVPKYKLLKTCL